MTMRSAVAFGFTLWLLFAGTVLYEKLSPSADVAEAQASGCPEPTGGWLGAPSYEPAPDNPDDCFFYTAAWQNFLAATQPDSQGVPVFIHYPNIANVFGSSIAPIFANLEPNQLSLAVRDMERPNSFPTQASRLMSIGEGVRQAGGLFGLVVDSVGNPIFYSIHVNDAYAAFIKTNRLVSKAAVETVPTLEFPPGVAEFKAAWAITTDDDPGNKNFIVTKATVPILRQANGVTRVTDQTRPAILKLVALHVAFVIKDHPEFIWTTFEHQDGVDTTDLAPSAETRDAAAAITVRSGVRYILFADGASRQTANSPCAGQAPSTCDPATTHPVLDPVAQTFTLGGKAQQTSVFREFPGAKSDRDEEDDSVASVNKSLRAVLTMPGRSDIRSNYRLVGATWLEHPRTTATRPGDFVLSRAFANPPDQNTEDRSRIVAGEDMLSSMAMESFTQRDSPNCFSCHDTKAIRSDEVGNPVILKATLLNVSHVISRFLSNPQ